MAALKSNGGQAGWLLLIKDVESGKASQAWAWPIFDQATRRSWFVHIRITLNWIILYIIILATHEARLPEISCRTSFRQVCVPYVSPIQQCQQLEWQCGLRSSMRAGCGHSWLCLLKRLLHSPLHNYEAPTNYSANDSAKDYTYAYIAANMCTYQNSQRNSCRSEP